MTSQKLQKLQIQKLRREVKETTEKELIRDSIALRDKKPDETLKVMFDMVNFAEKLSKLATK